ncbi:MAG TPA: DUF4232 domain-containing protein [Pyrinomonadaceae bacterium]|nr:DUF4232 domain-containing protein [Pyrinomonadaceae bacterium]
MKEVVRSKRLGPRMLFAVFALSTLFAHHAHAQDNSSAPAQCGDKQLSLRNYGETIGMGPMRSIEFIFTNVSSSPCTLSGHPSFEFLNRAGRPVRASLATDGIGWLGVDKGPPKLVTLAPGKTARFFVDYLARYDEDREKPCPSYRRLRVTAPGTKRVFVQRFRIYAIEVCSGLEVSPVVEPSGYD